MSSTDRNLLGGVLALQMDLVSGEQLLRAMRAWASHEDAPLLDLLRRDGVLSDDAHDALSRLVECRLEGHGGDAGESLAAVPLEDTRGVPASTGADSACPLIPPASAPLAAGPRFRRGRSHARGGLGEVFVAEDAELRREVALKEIQPQFADYADSRTRFVREAEITGQLEHPGVVPIYGLGVYGDGRPYYAMRFIRGESLQQAIDRFHSGGESGRDPGERTLALRGLLGRFVAVCNAVGYAHSRGIIHRDLKPANVMLGEFGETLVVDWGVARRMADDGERTLSPLSPPSNPDSAQTQQGQAIGTPAFMPPEQAKGELEHVGPASDLFSLGATLYDLLVGRPPYTGTGVLLQAAEGRFVAPRRVKPAVPAALEAVCQKAMSFLPEDRYAKARDLAADVDRWLADEPVSAHRDPPGVRAARWARHHRTLVSSLAVLLLASVAALAVGLVAVGREQVKTANALGRAEEAEGEAKANLIEAEDNLRRAEANLELARKAVDECFNIAKGHPRFQEEGLKDVKKLLLEKALPFYRNFRSQRPEDAELESETAEQHFRVAYIIDEIGSKEEARKEYVQARDLLSHLVEVHPKVPEYQRDLARAHNNLALLLEALGKREGARKEHLQARYIRTKLAQTQPNVSEYQSDLARTNNNLGVLLHALGEPRGALKEYLRARDLQTKLAQAHPDIAKYQCDRARTHNNLGNLLDTLGKKEEAMKEYRQANDIWVSLAKAQPDVSAYQSGLAGTHNNLAGLLYDRGEPLEAAKEYLQARDILTKLTETQPDISKYQGDRATAHFNLGNLLTLLGKPGEGMAEHLQARDIRTKLADAHPDVPTYQRNLASTHNNLGNLLHDTGKGEEALLSLRRSRDIYLQLAAMDRAKPTYRFEIGRSEALLARTHALLVARIEKDPNRPHVLRKQEAEKLAREALVYLERARINGAFANLAFRQLVMSDPAFASLSGRADFKRFLASLPATEP